VPERFAADFAEALEKRFQIRVPGMELLRRLRGAPHIGNYAVLSVVIDGVES
jgi:hypothetical protein